MYYTVKNLKKNIIVKQLSFSMLARELPLIPERISVERYHSLLEVRHLFKQRYSIIHLLSIQEFNN
jgi:hypothetical protein